MAKEKKKDPLVEATKKAKGTRAEQLGAIVKGAKKKYGHSVLHSASETEALIVPRVSTGLYKLDLRTNGGLPLRRVTMVYGPKSGGKTTLFLRALGMAQRLCANCFQPGEFEKGMIELPDLESGEVREVETQVIVSCPCGKPKDFLAIWIDAEGVWLPEWASRLGVMAEKVILMRPSHSEQAYNVAVAMINAGHIDLITIDSLAALTPMEEFEGAMEKQGQGVAARVNNKFIRKIVSGMNHCFQMLGIAPTLWAVNQYREKIGVMFGSPETVPGGKGQLFATSLEIECRGGKITLEEESGDPLSGAFTCRIKKNKVGVPGGTCEYSMCMQETDFLKVGDLMEQNAVIDDAVAIDLIQKPNAVMYEFEDKKFRGKGAMELFLIENPDKYESLKRRMLGYRLGFKVD